MNANEIDRLLAHADFVRAIARRILRDDQLAEDAAQETWIRALDRGPREKGAWRSWLGAVAANAARMRRRTRVRRRSREHAAAKGEATRSTGELVAELALQRDVAREVLALDEPLRATILHRYFEGRTFADIAAQERVSAEAVRRRHDRALEKLRRRFGRSLPGLALLAMVRPAAAGGILVSAKSKLVLVVAFVLLAAGGTLWVATPERRAPPDRSPVSTAERTAAENESGDVPPVAAAGRSVEVSGVVVDAAGRPVAGAEVGVWRDPGQYDGGDEAEFIAVAVTLALTRSRSDGTFSMKAPRGGAALLGAWTPDAASLAQPWLHLGADQPGFRIVLAAASPLEGRVVDGQGDPIRGAIVSVLPALRDVGPPPRHESPVRTGADGRFRTGPLPPGGITLYVRHAAHGSRVQAVDVPARSVEVALAGGVWLSGRTDPPREGVAIRAVPDAAWDVAPAVATTVADGTFRVGPLPPRRFFHIDADAGGHGRGRTWSVLTKEDPEPVIVVLRPVRRVRGVVRDAEDGTPVAGLRLIVSPQRELDSGADGSFTFWMPVGESAWARVAGRQEWWQLGTASAFDEETLRVAVVRASVVRGRVVDTDGRPVAGALVGTARGRSTNPDGSAGLAVTSANGTFLLRGVNPFAKSFQVCARKPDFLPAITTVAGEVVLVLERGVAVRGRLIDGEGRPVRGSRVALNPGTGLWRGRNRPVAYLEPVPTRDDGTFLFPAVPPSKRFLQILAPGHVREQARSVEIGASGLDLGDLRVRAGFTLAGRVVDDEGRPVSNASLSIGGGPTWGTARSGGGGRFAIRGLVAGQYKLWAGARGGLVQSPNPARLTLPREGELVVRLERTETLRSGLSIKGLVVDADGQPLDGAVVYAHLKPQWGGPAAASLRTRADGAFRIDGLKPGTHYLSTWPSRSGLAFAVQRVIAGDGAVVVQALRTESLQGRVVDPEGRPVPAVTVRLLREGSTPKIAPRTQSPVCRTNADGRFRFDGLLARSFTLLVHEADRVSAPLRSVPAGADRLELVARPALFVRGVVRDESGEPMSFAEVVVERVREPRFEFRVRAKRDGVFTVTGLGPGAIRLRCKTKNWTEVTAGDPSVTLVVPRKE